jgi:hypothetical protein
MLKKMPIHKSVLEQGTCQAAATLYKISPPACNAETVERLRLLYPEGDLDYPKDSRPSTQQETDFWEVKSARIS